MSTRPDLYRALACVYDAWQAQYGVYADTVLARLDPFLSRQWPQICSFVDLGCGTGTLLLSLGALHPAWRLVGVDTSLAMLARARAKDTSNRVRWHLCDLSSAIPDAPYDVAGCFFNTLNHLPDADALTAALTAAAAALRPAGALVFDVNNEIGFARWWQVPQRYQGEGWSLEIDPTFDPQRRRARARVVAHRDGSAQETIVEESCFSDDEIATAITRAGMLVESCAPLAPLPDQAPGANWYVVRRP